MTDTNAFEAEIFKNWERFQNDIVKAVSPLSSEQLTLASAPHMRSAGLITAHIVFGRVYWFNYVLGIGGPEVAVFRTWDDPVDGRPARRADELVIALEATWKLLREAIAGWSPADEVQPVSWMWQGEERKITRLWIIWHLIEHDLYHGGELSLTLGMHGIAAIDL